MCKKVLYNLSMSELRNIINFKGTWRTYQKRVLDHSDAYMKDGKIHIVAAPGSGKTTLGIELIARFDKPTLILTPSITIREQWKNRIESAFLKEGVNVDLIISQDLHYVKPITIATYQALHSAMTRYSGTIENDEEFDGEEVDFKGFDLVKVMKRNHMGVLCLDECHHLRSEWWKALEDFRSQMNDPNIIALTATPPYDSTPIGWRRYLDMCGDIDEEITVPELVKENSLCPHQDFVYFNYPTKEEEEIVDDFEMKSNRVLEELMDDSTFEEMVLSHKVLHKKMNEELLLDNPSYLSSILIYLHSKHINVPSHLQSLLGAKELPMMDLHWMEVLLQNMVFDHSEDFLCDSSIIESLSFQLKRKGLVEKRKVVLNSSAAIEKVLINSKGKIHSILDIVDCEYDSLHHNLRMLILTDYIRKEYEKVLGTDEPFAQSMGVIPLFEEIRRHTNKPKLGVLCGTIVIIPEESIPVLESIMDKRLLSYSTLDHLVDYVKVSEVGSSHFLTNAVTELFSRGEIEVLIGTKSLLGEGWDSPCVNSLILASFVGSFMLSNQMRGRAMRTVKDDPDKTSNIWHLVCVKSSKQVKKEKKETGKATISEDWNLLERRMQHFLGLHYTEDRIENGTDRLSCIHKPFNKENIEQTNKEMLELSYHRELLKERWNNALTIHNKMEVVDECEVDKDSVSSAVLYDGLRDLILGVLIFIVSRILVLFLPTWFIVVGVVALFWGLFKGSKLILLGSPYKRLLAQAKGILKALEEQNLISDEDHIVNVDHHDGITHSVYLMGGTNRDKEVFSQCIKEFYSEIDNQRYILVKKKGISSRFGYYAVPEIFSKNKESVNAFYECMKAYIGDYDCIYTRSEKGRQKLLDARKHAYVNVSKRVLTKKKVKSALE